ncbi:cupin domain-containing protein [Pseudomonas sp. SZMC_28357]|uniref:cupin domain-containing protein n=1 Tax=Pseudomonas sp. SZMC_28357 TaxID=3074380 RepID=UPI0028711A94|nr:cupin domain-containing protein [Pseudomonas sp. SZMC_28357]MDR9750236.1 cupin domain-containing protein [Pseudomonas sp. SZMC_28357]
MHEDSSQPLLLVPNGYPLWIDVPQASIDGAGTAMRFELPLNGHNLPLLHRRERKLVVALQGSLELRVGRQCIARLRPGEAVLVPAGTAHRIHQHGSQPSTVGAVLWPGRVEEAFRELATAATGSGYGRRTMVEILACYEVEWTAGAHDSEAEPLQVVTMAEGLVHLPEVLARAVVRVWAD